MRGKVLPTRAEFKSDRANLAKALTKRPHELFPASEGYDRSTTSQIRKQFPEFKVAVVGLAGAGKSTTLRWLLYYAGAARKWRRQVTVGAAGAASHTQRLNKRAIGESPTSASFVAFDSAGDLRSSCFFFRQLLLRFTPSFGS
jgi:hypothetical protein